MFVVTNPSIVASKDIRMTQPGIQWSRYYAKTLRKMINSNRNNNNNNSVYCGEGQGNEQREMNIRGKSDISY